MKGSKLVRPEVAEITNNCKLSTQSGIEDENKGCVKTVNGAS